VRRHVEILECLIREVFTHWARAFSWLLPDFDPWGDWDA
jgi:hypothetical protein